MSAILQLCFLRIHFDNLNKAQAQFYFPSLFWSYDSPNAAKAMPISNVNDIIIKIQMK